MREIIKNKNFSLLGYIDHLPNGDKVVTTTSGRLLGYYRKNLNITTNVSGTILARCDAAVCLLFGVEF